MVDTKAMELVISSILWHLKYFKTLADVTCNLFDTVCRLKLMPPKQKW